MKWKFLLPFLSIILFSSLSLQAQEDQGTTSEKEQELQAEVATTEEPQEKQSQEEAQKEQQSKEEEQPQEQPKQEQPQEQPKQEQPQEQPKQEQPKQEEVKEEQESNKETSPKQEETNEKSEEQEQPEEEQPKQPTTEEILGQINNLAPKVESLKQVEKILEQSSEQQVQLAIIDFLTKVGLTEQQSIEILLTLLNSSDGKVREEAIASVDLGALQKMRQILLGEEPAPRQQIAVFLARQGTNEIPLFLELIRSPNEQKKQLALEAFKSMGISAIPVLLRSHHTGNEDILVKIFSNMGVQAVAAMLVSSREFGEQEREIIVTSIAEMGVEGWEEVVRILRINPEESNQEIALDVALKIGIDILPTVLTYLDSPLSTIRNVAQSYIQQMDEQALPILMAMLQQEEIEKLSLATRALGYLGSKATPAIDQIIEFLNRKDDLQLVAARALQHLSQEVEENPEVKAALRRGVPELITAFKSRNWRVRAASAKVFVNLGPAAQPAFSALTSQFPREEYGDVRVAVVQAIANMNTKQAVPFLIRALQDQDETVVKVAATGLGKLGRQAKKAIEPLIRVLTEWGMEERLAAAQALANIGRGAIQQLRRTLRYNEIYAAREGAAMALGFMGPKAKSAVDSLIVALKFDEVIVKIAAAEALGKIGPVPGHRDIIALIEVIQSEPEIVREAASKALIEIGTPSIPHLIRKMRRGSSEARITMVRTLGNLGKDSAPAVNSLIDSLQFWQGNALQEVVRTLGKIGPAASSAVPQLISLLQREEDQQLRFVIGKTLVSFGEQVIPQVLPLLTSNDKGVRDTASKVLQELGEAVFPYMVEIVEKAEDIELTSIAIEILSSNVKSLPVLLNNLKHENAQIREAVIKGLIRIGPPAIKGLIYILTTTKISYEQEAASASLAGIGAEAVPELTNVIETSYNQAARLAAVDAIAEMGFEAKEAIPTLVKAVKKREGKEQIAVAKCLGQMGDIAIPHLLSLLEEERKSTQESVIIALAETQSRDAIVYLLESLKKPTLLPLVIEASVKLKDLAIPVLRTSLSEKDSHIRFACAAALAQIAPPQAIADLAKQSLQEENPMVKYMIQVALENCNQKLSQQEEQGKQ